MPRAADGIICHGLDLFYATLQMQNIQLEDFGIAKWMYTRY